MALDDPADIRMLEAMRTELTEAIQRRLDSGLTALFISSSVGRGRNFLNRVHDDPASWKFNEWSDLCKAAVAVPRLSFWGVPDDMSSLLWTMSRERPEFMGVGALDLLKQVRLARGHTHRSLAAQRGVVYSAIRQIEESDNPMLGTICRYARWVDLRARISTVAAWRGEMGAWK